MPFVSDADVQLHLPIDKLKVEKLPDDRSDQYEDAARIIRGYLSGVISSTIIATWATPENTPDVIRAIAGRLAAALIYRTRFSENSLADPEFAQNKYNEAMDMLMKVITGVLVIPGVESTDFDSSYFEPNNLSALPKFTMADRY